MLQILISICIILLVKIIIDHNKNSWFLKLKPEDEIKVRVKNKYSSCVKVAVVSNYANNNSINARLIDNEIEKCEKCTLKDECKYNVTVFKKGEVIRIKK